MSAYDYLVVGSGFAGATFARLAADIGKKVIVVEKSDMVGGLSKTIVNDDTGIIVHKFGPHIFHTSNRQVWDFVNRFCNMMPFVNSPMAVCDGKIYNLPINMNTLNEVFGVTDPKEAEDLLNKLKVKYDEEPKNFEEACKSKVGEKLYELFFKKYTEKQWHTDCKNVPANVFSSRQPVRFTYNNNYFNDIYQGIPKNGYTELILTMLSHPNIDISLNTDYSIKDSIFNSIADKVIYTGLVDRLFDYSEGYIRYNSVNFEHTVKNVGNYQGNAVINYCDDSVDYTRITEHKFFNIYSESFNSNKTVITYETPQPYIAGKNVPMYPVNSGKDTYDKYIKYIPENLYLLGRLATFKYLNMDQAILQAFELFDSLER